MNARDRAAAAGVAAILAAAALAVPMIAEREGVPLVGYRDPVGIPTECAGHTKNAVVGRVSTIERCMDLLAVDTVEHGLAIAPCIKVAIPTESRAAFTSFAFNVGASAFCKSTLVRKVNQGDLAGGCAELSRWTYAGGRQLPGLVERRKAERAFCERGLNSSRVPDPSK